MRSVSRDEAMRRSVHCQYVHGQGFYDHGGPPVLPEGASGAANCLPAVGTADGSMHVLQPPGGHPEMTMVWRAAESAWAPTVLGKGNRMAWTHDHLARAGWSYKRSAEDQKQSKKPKRGALVRGDDSR